MAMECDAHVYVRSHYQSIWKTENSTTSKYKMAKDIRMLPRVYDYISEFSCAKSKQNWLAQFCWGNV